MSDVSPPERDGVIFAPRSVRGRGQPPLAPVALAVALGGLLLSGLVQPPVETSDVRASGASTPAARPSSSGAVAAEWSRGPRARPASGDAALMQVRVKRDGLHMFVHAEVYTRRISVIVVSLRDARGTTAATTTLILPGGSTAFRIGAVDRFDIQFDHPDPGASGSITIQASGYDAADDRIASVQIVAGGEDEPIGSGRPHTGTAPSRRGRPTSASAV